MYVDSCTECKNGENFRVFPWYGPESDGFGFKLYCPDCGWSEVINMKELILKPQFIDRGGYTVYHIHERDGEKRYYSAGQLVGQVRLKMYAEDFKMLEWVKSDDE